jgi:biotin carboxyl carrier protein
MYKAIINNNEFEVDFSSSENKAGTINNSKFEIDSIDLKDGHFNILKNNKSYNAEIVSFDADEKTYKIKVNGNVYTVKVKDRFDLLLQSMGMDALTIKKVNELKAPMPGLVLDVRVKVGDVIKKGEPLVVLEAMKMENVLKSVADVTIKKIAIEKGNAVEKNQVLIFFE